MYFTFLPVSKPYTCYTNTNIFARMIDVTLYLFGLFKTKKSTDSSLGICYQCHLKLPKQTTSYGEGDTQGN